MGIIFSYFKKNISTNEALEKIENEIKQCEKNKATIETTHERIKKILLIICIVVWLICAVLCFFYGKTLIDKLQLMVIFCVFLLLLWYCKRIVKKNQTKLEKIKKEKKAILDQVMEKETYNKAKEILEKFSMEVTPKPILKTPLKISPNLRQRIVSNVSSASPFAKNPGGSKQLVSTNLLTSTNNTRVIREQPMLRMPAPVLSPNRSYVDKLVEYLIGDGPNNRYALICSQCHSHNGMALKEEFEYTSFKCCYCFFYNAARKLRPEAPKLEFMVDNHSENSDSESRLSSEGYREDLEFEKETLESDELLRSNDNEEKVENSIKNKNINNEKDSIINHNNSTENEVPKNSYEKNSEGEDSDDDDKHNKTDDRNNRWQSTSPNNVSDQTKPDQKS